MPSCGLRGPVGRNKHASAENRPGPKSRNSSEAAEYITTVSQDGRPGEATNGLPFGRWTVAIAPPMMPSRTTHAAAVSKPPIRANPPKNSPNAANAWTTAGADDTSSADIHPVEFWTFGQPCRTNAAPTAGRKTRGPAADRRPTFGGTSHFCHIDGHVLV